MTLCKGGGHEKIIIRIKYIFVVAGTQNSLAAQIEWDLNCVISDGVCTDSALTWGSVKLTDVNYNGFQAIQIEVNLTGLGIHKVLEVALNYDDTLFENDTAFSLVSGSSVDVDENAIKLQSYDGFDLEPTTSNNAFEPWGDVLYLINTNLNVNMFNFIGGVSDLYAAVHIGNYGDEPGEGGGNSITVGANDPGTPVPEPATMLLFGAGLAGLAGFARRKVQ